MLVCLVGCCELVLFWLLSYLGIGGKSLSIVGLLFNDHIQDSFVGKKCKELSGFLRLNISLF